MIPVNVPSLGTACWQQESASIRVWNASNQAVLTETLSENNSKYNR